MFVPRLIPPVEFVRFRSFVLLLKVRFWIEPLAVPALNRIPLTVFETVPPEILANPFVKTTPVVVAEIFEFRESVPVDENEIPTPFEA